MSQPQPALTIEGILELFRQTDLRIDKRFQDTAKQIDKTSEAVEVLGKRVDKTSEIVETVSKTVGALGNRVGDLIEKLLGEGNLVAQFRELGYNVKTHSQNKVFGKRGTAGSGEIDLFLEDGDVAILVEAKTTLKMDHVIDHIQRIEKYRRFVDADGSNGKRFVGAVAGTMIAENVINYAHENGLYVIVQSARAVEIMPQPDGFVVRKW
ncbi:MAG: hypothetical protein FWE67_04960 [Planctomycetaceae bacterium]|nr:hypothetical protein [Planctomycetaceae bacterium]